MADDKHAAVHLTADDFKKTLEEAGDKPVMVDFYAEWCGPCKLAAPIIEELAEERKADAIIAKVDVDEHNSLAQEYGVISIPTVIVFKNGEEVARDTGFKGKDAFVKLLEKGIN